MEDFIYELQWLLDRSDRSAHSMKQSLSWEASFPHFQSRRVSFRGDDDLDHWSLHTFVFLFSRCSFFLLKMKLEPFWGSMSVSHTTVTLCWLQPFSSSFNEVVLLLWKGRGLLNRFGSEPCDVCESGHSCWSSEPVGLPVSVHSADNLPAFLGRFSAFWRNVLRADSHVCHICEMSDSVCVAHFLLPWTRAAR